MTYARDEAIRLVQWILESLDANESLSIELPFRDVRRKADLAIISQDRLSAIEIKGARDNTQTLEKQIADYQEMFLDVTIATAPRHLNRVREITPRAVGIVLLDSQSVRLLRKPTRRRNLSRIAAANWLDRNELATLIGRSNVRDLGIAEARELAAESFSSDELTRQALSSISSKNSERFAAFLRERSKNIDLDDLHMLALQPKVRR
ncbi:hypothetical protein FB548_0427 [Pseudoxanthomonas sp. 3HH-4]|nr:hypothetical protein FB548_0427 [Pseudoxanthomonas sp. 3HH-4]